MIKITRRPHEFCFSKNPVQYNLSVSEFDEVGCYVQVRIYTRAIGGGAATLLYEEKIKPLTALIEYNIADVVESSLNYATPNFSGPLFQPGQNIKEFYIDYSVITDASPTAVWVSDADNAINIIKGGIAAPLWDWNNYFRSYVPAQRPFLTWQPQNRFIGKDDAFFISWLNTQADVPLSLLVDVEYSDGYTTQIINDFAASDKILYHIKAGAGDLGINALDPGKQLYKYSLSIVSTADNDVVFASPYTYYIDYRQFYNAKFLHYYNSLGGIEYVRVRGEIETNVDITFADAEKFGGALIIGTPASEQYTQTAKNKVDSFKGDTGYFHTAKEQDVLQELLLTRYAWERIIGKNLRIYSISKGAKLRTTNDKLWSFAIEWRYSFTNSVYTPLIDLGVGVDETPDYCQAVAIPAGQVMAAPIIDKPYTFIFHVTGDLPISLGSVVKPLWMAVNITDRTITCTGTPTAADTDAISIELTNCSAYTATFAQSITTDCIGIEDDLSLPDPQVGVAYNYSVQMYGTQPFVLSDIVKPAWMTITVVDDEIIISGTPDTASIETVSFTVTGCRAIAFSQEFDVSPVPCDQWQNTTGDVLTVRYKPCGSDYLITMSLGPGKMVCGRAFNVDDVALLTYVGIC